MHNLLYVNDDNKVAEIFSDLTSNSPPAVQQWFVKTLYRHWQTIWAKEGPGRVPFPARKIFISADIVGRDDPKFRAAYVTIHGRLNRPPALTHAIINGDKDDGIAFSALDYSQLKALRNGAIPVLLRPFQTTSLIHLRDFLEYFHAENPKKELSKLAIADLPAMVATWNAKMRKLKAMLENEQSIVELHKAKNGWSICVIGSIAATKHVGLCLRNCLRYNTSSYFENGSLFCVKNPDGKILAALDVRTRHRVAIQQLPGMEPKTISVIAFDLEQFYGPENTKPAAEAVVAYNEWVTTENIRVLKDTTQLATTTQQEWDDAEEEDEDEADASEEDDEEKAVAEEDEDEEPRPVLGRRRAIAR